MKNQKLNFKILVIYFTLGITGFSQFVKVGSKATNYIFPSAFTNIGVEAWATGGSTIADNELPTGAYNNPAGIWSDNISFYAEFGKRSIANYNYDDWDGQFILPAYISVSIPNNIWKITFGYMNLYNLSISTKLSTYDQTGFKKSFIESKERLQTHTIFGAGCYKLINQFSIGFAAGITYLVHDNKFGHLNSNGNGFGSLIILGILYTPIENLSIGGTYKTISEIKYDMDFESNFTNTDTTGNSEIANLYTYSAKFPNSFEIGLKYILHSNLILHGKLETQLWPENSRVSENLLNFHIGAEFLASDFHTLRFGFFTLYNEDYSVGGAIYDQYFLTCGFSWKIIPKIKVSVSVLDSHLFNNKDFEDHYGKVGEQFHQTYMSAGFSYSL